MREVYAKGLFLRSSSSKMGLVADQIRGKSLAEARTLLKFSYKKAAQLLLKVLNSAAANAKENLNLTESSLKVAKVLVGQGPTMKRIQPVSRGMAHPILKRTVHVSVYLQGEEEVKKSPEPKGKAVKPKKEVSKTHGS